MIKKIVEQYFSFVLVAGCIVGLFAPDAGNITPYLLLGLLSVIVFSAYFQLEGNASTLRDIYRKAILFQLLRFVLLPVLAYLSVAFLGGDYAIIVLLLFSLPSALSSPAISKICGGDANLSVAIVIVSNFSFVVLLPLACRYVLGNALNINILQLATNLFYSIIVPFLFFLPVRKSSTAVRFFKHNNAVVAAVCLSFIFMIATAGNKQQIAASGALFTAYLASSGVLYSALYLIVLFGFRYLSVTDRVTSSISSGANNIGLGITVATLHFSPTVAMFFVVSEIVWVLILIPVKYFYARYFVAQQ